MARHGQGVVPHQRPVERLRAEPPRLVGEVMFVCEKPISDSDETVAAIAASVLKRTGAQPWRSVNPHAGIHEESLLDELLDDLRSGCVGQRRLT